MKYEDAKSQCHVRSAIYRTGDPTKVFTQADLYKLDPRRWDFDAHKVGTTVPKRYWKNHPVLLDDQVPDADKAFEDWEEFDPRDEETFYCPA